MKIFSLVLVLTVLSTACKKKEEAAPAEKAQSTEADKQPMKPEIDQEEVPFPAEEEDLGEINALDLEEPAAAAPSEAKKPQTKVAAKAVPAVDPALISQRVKTYRDDIGAFDQKAAKYLEVQQKFKGDDAEFDAKFQEDLAAYEEEKSNFNKRLKSLKKNPSLVQWEAKEREWADEWRHVVRAFNDLEASYEKQYEGLK